MKLEQLLENLGVEARLFLRPKVILVVGKREHLVIGPKDFIESAGLIFGHGFGRVRVRIGDIGGSGQVQEMSWFSVGVRIITEESGGRITGINGWSVGELVLRPPIEE